MRKSFLLSKGGIHSELHQHLLSQIILKLYLSPPNHSQVRETEFFKTPPNFQNGESLKTVISHWQNPGRIHESAAFTLQCTPSSWRYSSFMPHRSTLNIGSLIIGTVVLTGNYSLPLFIFNCATASQRHGPFHLPSHMGDWLPISCPHCKRITIPRQHRQCCYIILLNGISKYNLRNQQICDQGELKFTDSYIELLV